MTLEQTFPVAVDFVQASYDAYTGLKRPPEGLELPLVSVVMTAYNAADTIERSVRSLLEQSYPNLEIVICDDASTDETYDILIRLSREDSRVRVLHLETNSGTYLAKNVAICHARGEIILFQDSDDYSHVERVMVQVLPLLTDPNVLLTRAKWTRFNPETGTVIPQDTHVSKYTFITLAVRRDVFNKIGYFDAVRKAGDDEWYQRLIRFLGRKPILHLDVTLYRAEIRGNNLTADSTFMEGGVAKWRISPDRKRYLDYFKNRLQERPVEWFRQVMTPYPLRTQDEYGDGIAALPGRHEPVFIGLCSIPERSAYLLGVIQRLENQVDGIIVYLDKYTEVPKELSEHKKVHVLRSQHYTVDFRDHAKFLLYNEMKRKHPSFYYVTCDDDIVYPYDYVRTLLTQLDKYENRIAVGVHGVICPEVPEHYYRERLATYLFSKSLPQSKLVNVLGTGTVAFHSSLFESLDPYTWGSGGMADIFFALAGQEQRVPFVSVSRRSGWLKALTSDVTLWGEFQRKEALIFEQLRRRKWGYRAIQDVLEFQPQHILKMLKSLIG